jgi:hypothetical protein
MKKIFFIVAIAAFSFASAQNDNKTIVSPKPGVNSSDIPNRFFINPPKPQLMVNGQIVNTLPNGNKVYALPQDHMPCVVPDMTQYNMPVFKPDIVYTIPNPAFPRPPSNKPLAFPEEQLKRLLEKHKKQN